MSLGRARKIECLRLWSHFLVLQIPCPHSFPKNFTDEFFQQVFALWFSDKFLRRIFVASYSKEFFRRVFPTNFSDLNFSDLNFSSWKFCGREWNSSKVLQELRQGFRLWILVGKADNFSFCDLKLHNWDYNLSREPRPL